MQDSERNVSLERGFTPGTDFGYVHETNEMFFSFKFQNAIWANGIDFRTRVLSTDSVTTIGVNTIASHSAAILQNALALTTTTAPVRHVGCTSTIRILHRATQITSQAKALSSIG